MQPLPNQANSAGSSASAAPHRLRRYRHRIPSLVYVKLDTDSAAVIRNLSEDGMAIQGVGHPRLGQQLALRFELMNPRLRVEACGCVVWIDPHGQAGVEFLDVEPWLRRRLQEWIFHQLMATAELAGAKSIFADREIAPAGELTFSENARVPIMLESEPSTVEQAELAAEQAEVESLEVSPAHGKATPWWVIDGLILACAVLLFLVIALGMTNSVPTWPVAAMLALAVTGAFTGLYWFLFEFWMGRTPGEHLIRLAAGETAEVAPDGSEPDSAEDQPRFR